MAQAQFDFFSEDKIEESLKSRRSLALYRIRLLQTEECDGDDGGGATRASGFPSLFLPLLGQSIDKFIEIISRCDGADQNSLLSKVTETADVLRLLKIYRRISELDTVLDEEIAKEGAHFKLSKLIKIDVSSIEKCRCNDDDDINEANQDTIIEIQDLACEIASCSKTFPLPASPFMREDLIARLPLVFNIHPVSQFQTCQDGSNDDGITILINQVTERQSAQKDVGFVMWPSAVVLSRWLVSNPKEIQGKTVLELGAGCGLTGLVAAKILQNYKNQLDNETAASTAPSNPGSVVLSDFNETVVKNLKVNIELNDLHEIATVEGLDFYQQDPNARGRLTTDGVQCPDLADIIVAADVICQPSDAFAAARSIASALREGGKAIVVSADSKHRFGVEKLEEACQTVGSLSILSKSNVDDYLHSGNNSGSTSLRDDDMEKTSGFVHGMKLTMYTIRKGSKL